MPSSSPKSGYSMEEFTKERLLQLEEKYANGEIDETTYQKSKAILISTGLQSVAKPTVARSKKRLYIYLGGFYLAIISIIVYNWALIFSSTNPQSTPRQSWDMDEYTEPTTYTEPTVSTPQEKTVSLPMTESIDLQEKYREDVEQKEKNNQCVTQLYTYIENTFTPGHLCRRTLDTVDTKVDTNPHKIIIAVQIKDGDIFAIWTEYNSSHNVDFAACVQNRISSVSLPMECNTHIRLPIILLP